ncbi:MAG: hypothetical protein JNK64_28375 [Myxococcales bacterium]|nr:hypothetical protein [Myxococcales bacterium]
MLQDHAPLTWVEAPPAPQPAPSAVEDALVAVRADGAVTLTGSDGSGRRTTALHVAAALALPAYLVPGLPWRAPEALREISRRLDQWIPPRQRPQVLVTIAQATLAERPGGTIIVDARVKADPGLLAALRPPPGWRAILLAPRGLDADVAWGAAIDLPDASPPATPEGDDAAALTAASYFDPWEGAPRALVAAVADLPRPASDAAIDRLVAAGRLRPARDPARVLPTLHDYQARPEVTDPRERPFAERFVAAVATLCGRTIPDPDRTLALDRANIMTALSIWPAVAPKGLVVGFAHALPVLIDDLGCDEAAKAVMSVGRYGDDAAQQAIARAEARLAGT